MHPAQTKRSGIDNTPTHITIRAVEDKTTLNDFIRVPLILYKNDPYFAARPDFEMRAHLTEKNPYLRKVSYRYFVAYNQDNNPIGRVSAQIMQQSTVGHFGLIEADTPNTLTALLKEAEHWLTQQGAKTVSGPYSLSINDEAGLLVEGFESRPRLLMNYAQDWYKNALVQAGYQKAKDLIAYEIKTGNPLPKAAARMAEHTQAMENVTVRPLTMRHFKDELKIITTIFNDAWADNWGFMPFDDDDLAYMAHNMKPIIVPDMAQIAFIDNKPAAMIVALPDINEALQDMNGKLLPFNWAKLLWRLKVKGLSSARVLLMGICKEHAGTPLAAGFAALLIEKLRLAAEDKGINHVEMSWVLEDNAPTDRLIRMAGGLPYKRYRIFEKAL